MIDLPLLYRIEAVARAVADGRADVEVATLANLARSHPDRVAAMVVALAAACRQTRVDELIDVLAARGTVDLSEVAHEGHRVYVKFSSRGDVLVAPRWVLAAERLRSRLAHRRRKAG